MNQFTIGPESVPGRTRIPFSPVDEAVHLLDSEAAPWSVQVEIRVAASLETSRLRAAIARALTTHPMARARKVASRRSEHRDHWEIQGRIDVDPLRVVECPDDTGLDALRAELQSMAVPLVESPPVRFCLARHPDGDILMLNANHAAMDAFGALRLLSSVGRAYAGEPDPLSEPALLKAREAVERLADADVPTRLRRHLALAEKLRDLVAPPARVARRTTSREAGYGFHQVSLPAARTQALVGRHQSGTVNDVLLSALHLAIAGWNAEQGEPCGRIGVLVPANLRPREWRRDVVGNFSLPARVSTSPRSRRSPELTLRTLTTQTERKKRTGMGCRSSTSSLTNRAGTTSPRNKARPWGPTVAFPSRFSRRTRHSSPGWSDREPSTSMLLLAEMPSGITEVECLSAPALVSALWERVAAASTATLPN